MKRVSILFTVFGLILMVLMSCSATAQPANKSAFYIGDKFSFSSSILDHQVEVFVGLPENYHRSEGRYPVHFVLDGQILFKYYYGVADILTKGEIPECIVVGIQSMKRGYFFKPGTGAVEFSGFLVNELIPHIDANYRTSSFRSILGHSTTGAFIIDLFLRHPDEFDLFFAGAPYHSEMFGKERLDSLPEKFMKKKYLYSFYGLKDNPAEKLEWDSIAWAIQRKNIENLTVINNEYQDAGHYDIVFRYIPDGLKQAFAGWGHAIRPGEEFSFSKFSDYENYQLSRFNVTFSYTEGYYVSNAIGLSNRDDMNTAIQLLSRGLLVYPESDVLHNVLAAQYEKSGNMELVIEHYQKALEINPNLDFIRKKLAELE